MILSVTFQAPVLIPAELLPAFLSMAGTPALVVPAYDTVDETLTEEAPVTGSEGALKGNGESPAYAITGNPVADPEPEVKRRGRKPGSKNAAKVDAPPADDNVPVVITAGEVVQPPAESRNDLVQPVVDPDLLGRFTDLVDKNYDGALQLLEHFGLARFSNLLPENQKEFGSALAELGV